MAKRDSSSEKGESKPAGLGSELAKRAAEFAVTLFQGPFGSRVLRLWNEGYLHYLIACICIGAAANFAYNATLAARNRAEAARDALFSETEPFRGDLYPGLSAAITNQVVADDSRIWSVSCHAPDVLVAFDKFSAEIADAASRHCLAYRQPVPWHRPGRRRLWLPNLIAPGEDCAAYAVASRGSESRREPAFLGGPTSGEPLVVAYHLATSDGNLFFFPGAPDEAIDPLRTFNGTSYFYAALDGKGQLQCNGSTYPDVIETRPYIDLAGAGLVVTICRSLTFSTPPTVTPFASGEPRGVFCADVQVPQRYVVRALSMMRFADIAIVETKAPKADNTAVTATNCPSEVCRRLDSLNLAESDLAMVANNVSGDRLRYGTFKAGDKRHPELYGLVLSNKASEQFETYQVLIIKSKRLSIAVGFHMGMSVAMLFLAAWFLVPARRRSEEKAVREISRTLQVGVVRTGLFLPYRTRGPALVSQQVNTLAQQIEAAIGTGKGLEGDAKSETARRLAREALYDGIDLLTGDFHPYERIESTNSLATALLGVTTPSLVTSAPSELVAVAKTEPDGRRTYEIGTYSDVQSARARGRATEYFVRFELNGRTRLLRFIGAPVRLPEDTFQTFAVVEVAPFELEDVILKLFPKGA